MNKAIQAAATLMPHNTRDNNINVIFKGLNKCNAGCSFCCIGDPGGAVISWQDFCVMADELEALVKNRNMKHITFTFHGGEPSLYKADFLDRMCRRIRDIDVEVSFNMQSNLLALPTSIKNVVIQHGIKIGTSIDPLGIDRVRQNGRSGFPAWLKTFVRFSRESEPPGAIYVITRNSLNKETIIYDICETIGSLTGQRFALQLNPVYAQGKVSSQQDDLSITPEEYGEFMINFWRLWEHNRRSISVTPVQSFARHFLPDNDGRAPHLACSYNGHCPGSHMGVDYNLNIAGCGRRLDSEAFIGNLHVDSLSGILGDNLERKRLSGRVSRLAEGDCGHCSYFAICHGGCPDDAWIANGDVEGKTHWCESHRMLFDAMQEEIKRIRRPVSVPPAIPRTDNDLANILVADHCDQLPETLEPRTEVWMLPDRNLNWLQFDSPLSRIITSYGSPRVRLWCHNDQVTSLMMWEDLIHRKGVSVVLFEAKGLEKAMNMLNSLNALIILDLASIVKQDDEKVLAKVLDRYLRDPLWRSQILPFSQMIKAYINREPIRLYNEFGLINGGYRIIRGKNMAVDNSIVDRLEKAKVDDPVHWFLDRYSCTDCTHYRLCAMRFADGKNRLCAPVIRDYISQLHESAIKLEACVHGDTKH